MSHSPFGNFDLFEILWYFIVEFKFTINLVIRKGIFTWQNKIRL